MESGLVPLPQGVANQSSIPPTMAMATELKIYSDLLIPGFFGKYEVFTRKVIPQEYDNHGEYLGWQNRKPQVTDRQHKH